MIEKVNGEMEGRKDGRKEERQKKGKEGGREGERKGRKRNRFKNGSSGNENYENFHDEDEDQAKLLKINHMISLWLNTCIILSFFIFSYFIDEL